MTREEYLDILQNNLHGIPPQEAENIMEYYREYFAFPVSTRPCALGDGD